MRVGSPHDSALPASPRGKGSARAPAGLRPGPGALRRARGLPRASFSPSHLGWALGAARVAGPEGTGRGGGECPGPAPAPPRSGAARDAGRRRVARPGLPAAPRSCKLLSG